MASRSVFDDTSLSICFLILEEVTRREREGEGQGGREVRNAIGRSEAEKRSKKKKRQRSLGIGVFHVQRSTSFRARRKLWSPLLAFFRMSRIGPSFWKALSSVEARVCKDTHEPLG